jgi:type I restriction enzyme S subunit
VIDGFPLIATNCVKAGKREPVFENVRYIDDKTYRSWFRAHPSPGDILFVCKGSPGRVAVVPDPVPFCIAQDMVALRAETSVVDSRYLYYRLVSADVQASIANMHVGTMIPHFKKGDFDKLRFTVHNSLDEQRAIAEVLWALDDKIAANDRVTQTSMLLAGAKFQHAVHELHTVRRVSLGELQADGAIELGDGYRTNRSEHDRDGFCIVRAGDVARGRLVASGDDFVSLTFERQVGAKAVQPGDVVLTTKGSVGRVAVAPPDIGRAVYSPQLCYFRVKDPSQINQGYLAGWFTSDDLQRQAAQRMFKSDMAPYINLQDIRSMRLPLPSMALQVAIGSDQARLQQLFASVDGESRTLRRTRDALLPLLMSGKVRTQDADQVVEGVV